MNDAIIIGYGTVGKATQKILKCDYVDKNDSDTDKLYEFAIVCVKREDLPEAIKSECFDLAESIVSRL